jgi:hypothetical protein
LISQERAAELLNIGVASVERAKAVLAFADLAAAVGRGLIRVSAAALLAGKSTTASPNPRKRYGEGRRSLRARDSRPPRVRERPSAQLQAID